MYMQNKRSNTALTAQVPMKQDPRLRQWLNCFESGHEVRRSGVWTWERPVGTKSHRNKEQLLWLLATVFYALG